MLKIYRSIFNFSQVKTNPPPELLPFELEPFKFHREKQYLHQNYTYEELYGAYLGLKHAEPVRKEMLKDTIIAGGLLAFFTFLAFNSRANKEKDYKDWMNYHRHDLNTKRDIPVHALRKARDY